MSSTRTRGSVSSYTARRIQIQEPTAQSGPDSNVPKCSGHDRRCKEFTAGAASKNPGRKFFTCPLSRDDPQRCKFFKWADESVTPSSTTRLQTLGQSPRNIYDETPRPITTPTKLPGPMTPQTASRPKPASTDEDEIDWDRVDTDTLEKEALASTPSSSQREPDNDLSHSLTARLQDVGETPSAKRKRDDLPRTPTRGQGAQENPFLSPSNLNPAAHPNIHLSLSPSLSALESVSEQLHRQDRLIHAGELAKEGFRKTIKRQQERIEQLERRVAELEGK